MLRKMDILIIFFVLSHVSCVLSRSLNLTQLVKQEFYPELYYQHTLRNVPVIKDLTYLLGEDYDEKQETRETELQHLDRNNRNLNPKYRDLCETITKKVEFIDSDYEYQPPYYHEIFCKDHPLLSDNMPNTRSSEQKCVHPAFHCIQKSGLLLAVRRRWENDCWEPYTKIIAGGCDCMWPISTLGEIIGHY